MLLRSAWDSAFWSEFATLCGWSCGGGACRKESWSASKW
jgi:hypothetical protein